MHCRHRHGGVERVCGGSKRDPDPVSLLDFSPLPPLSTTRPGVCEGGGGVGWFAIQVQMFRNQASPIRPLRHALRHSPRCATDSIPGRGLPAEDTAALSYVTNSSRRQEPSPWQATTPPVRQTLGPTRPNASLIARSSLLDWGPRRMTCFRSYFSLPGQPWSIASRSACLAAFFFVA